MSLIAAPIISSWPGSAAALTDIELLGKNIFFDEISIPGNKQACASCHDGAKGGTLPNSAVNNTTVVAPGAKPHALGNIKTPTNAYASYSPPFRSFDPGPAPIAPWEGGNFWDGRAEGCGAAQAVIPGTICPSANPAGKVSATITLFDLPTSKQLEYEKYLGPTADQALNPFPNTVEQNIREKNVCQRVKTAKYKDLYDAAFGEAIDCSPNPKDSPAYRTSYKRIAVALAAWQASTEVNSFSSKRDTALLQDKDGKFPLDGLTPQENLGHDLFYGRARCNACHIGVPAGEPADPTGEKLHQLYSDNRFHNIGTPFNREIPGVAAGEKAGLASHVTNVAPGFFRTPTVRNVGKGASAAFVKAYTHNGWFKSLERLVHFYNTRDVLPDCESFGITNATEKEALANDCWPVAEFEATKALVVVGNLGLTFEPYATSEEAALVAYMQALTDKLTPRKP
ncbi:MAG: cytochrome-c peroxidase [Hyphomicrobium sp.]